MAAEALPSPMRRTLFALLLCACARGSVDGLAPAEDTGGPKVLFDLKHTPLPEVPLPNDIATRPDPTSPTGLRVNASQIAPTRLEQNVRRLLDGLDGFGIYAPITVAFDKDLDVLDLYARQNDTDPANDAVYLAQIDTGEVFPLDVNGGHFPSEIDDGGRYFRNDPDADVTNLMFPVTGPTANFLHPTWPATSFWPQATDDLMTFYERATRTLILRPVLPLRQETRYAVLLTKRLKGTDGKPVVSPFHSVNHVLQNGELRPLFDHLPAGLQASDIAFAWAFTTQSTTRELEAIREGLYGRGPLAALSTKHPVTETRPDGKVRALVTPMASLDAADNVYVLPVAKLLELLTDPAIGPILVGQDQAVVQALIDSMKYIDYYITGSFQSSNFLDDPTRPPQDATFDLDLHTGRARTSPETIYFFGSIPKALGGHKPPFPVALYGHGYTSMRLEGVLLAGGQAAKFGFSMMDIEAFGHGLDLDPFLESLIREVLRQHGMGAFAEGLFKSRARDLDNDGIPDSGGDFWTADTFHTRDVVRQSIVDWFQLVRLMRSFDGKNVMQLGGRTVLAGDFNDDGVPDLGGPVIWPVGSAGGFHAGDPNPGSDTFVFGSSLGGILASILPAVEPAIVAAAPVSGGSGLGDVGVRSTLGHVVEAVFLEVMGPLLVTCNWSAQEQTCDGAGAQPSLIFQVQQVNHDAVVPIAPVTLHGGDVVTVCNLAHAGDCRSTTADPQGRIRISLAADAPELSVKRTPRGVGKPDLVEVTVTKPGDPLRVTVNGSRDIDTYEYPAQFVGVKYAKGDPLTSPARGYGMTRNTPDFRRLWGLSQMILEPGDPVSYAPHYFKDLLPARNGVPANVLVVATVGDQIVPVATGIATARAAGLIELSQPDAAYGLPVDQVLIRGGAVEGLARLRRYASADAGPRAALGSHLRCDNFVDRTGAAQSSNCAAGINLDPTGYACDGQGLNCLDDMGAPRLSPPLREQVARHTSAGISALIMPFLDPRGRHAVHPPEPNRRFDMDQFMLNLMGRFFETRGKELHFERCQSKMADCPWIVPLPK
jgi:hypothetical protein